MKPSLIAFSIFGFIFLIFGLGIFLRAEGIWETKTFGVAEQNAQTEVYQHSEAYREGTQRDFDELYLEYQRAADPASKQAILSVIRHRAEGVPTDQVPSNIRSLLQ